MPTATSHLRLNLDSFAAAIGQDVSHRFYAAFHVDDNAASADELAPLGVAGASSH